MSNVTELYPVQGGRPSAPLQPWERDARPGHDTGPAWEAFVIFRDMGPTRKVERVAEQLGKRASGLSRWTTRDDWWARAAAYDRYQDAKARDKLDSMKYRVLERLAMIARRGEAVLLEALAQTDPSTLSPQDIAAFARTFVELERSVYFPKEAPDANLTAAVNIIMDPNVLSPATATMDSWQHPPAPPQEWIDAEEA